MLSLPLNLGCGDFPLPNYWNWDANPRVAPDRIVTVPPIPLDSASVPSIYMGHLLEHLHPDAAHALLAECYRVLTPGGTLTVVVPDTQAIMRRYLTHSATVQQGGDGRTYHVADLDDVCAYWLFSTYQDSPHQWAYDESTLTRALTRAGFVNLAEIDRYGDPRLSDRSWWQLGFDGLRP